MAMETHARTIAAAVGFNGDKRGHLQAFIDALEQRPPRPVSDEPTEREQTEDEAALLAWVEQRHSGKDRT